MTPYSHCLINAVYDIDVLVKAIVTTACLVKLSFHISQQTFSRRTALNMYNNI